MMNFDKLPCDIKRQIFDCNRAEAVERTKMTFSDVVLDELLRAFTYATRDEDGEFIDVHNHHDYRAALTNLIAFDPFQSDDETAT